jgi:hypothetical protein
LRVIQRNAGDANAVDGCLKGLTLTAKDSAGDRPLGLVTISKGTAVVFQADQDARRDFAAADCGPWHHPRVRPEDLTIHSNCAGRIA